MTNRKINLDRPHISSEEIQAKQNFDHVFSKFQAIKTPIWKSPWFWGSTGLASVATAVVIGLSSAQTNTQTNDKTNTLTSNQLPPDTECIKPPLKGEDIPFSTYLVNPNREETISTLHGTKIHFPKGSLQAINSNEKVEISVREFRDKASAFVAGIKMDVNQKDAFESAGMIEIRGVQAGKEVKINPEKPVEIALRLTQDPNGFDFWKMNESTNQWENYPVEYSTEKVNGEIVKKPNNSKIKNELVSVEKSLKQVESSLENMHQPTQIEYKIPQKGHQKFDLGFEPGAYPELAGFKDVIFEIIPTTGYDKKFASKVWKDAQLEKVPGGYQMVLTNTHEKLILPVRPTLQGQELKEAEKKWDDAIQTYSQEKSRLETEKQQLEQRKISLNQSLLSQLNAEEARYKQTSMKIPNANELAVRKSESEMNDFQREAQFTTTSWGLFNSDKPIAYPLPLENQPYFVWKGNADAKLVSLYVFDLDKNTRYSYGKGNSINLNDFGFYKRNDVVLIGIDEEGKIGSCSISKKEDATKWTKFTFERKESDEKTVDWLKNMLHETVPA